MLTGNIKPPNFVYRPQASPIWLNSQHIAKSLTFHNIPRAFNLENRIKTNQWITREMVLGSKGKVSQPFETTVDDQSIVVRKWATCAEQEREREKERCRTTGKFIHDHPNIWRARASQIADKKAVCGRGGARNRNFMFPDQTKWALWVTSCGVGIERGLFNFADSWRPKCISLHPYLLYKK